MNYKWLGLITCSMLVSLGSVSEAGFVAGTTNDISFIDRSQAATPAGTASTALRPGDRFYGVFSADGITANGVEDDDPTPEITGVYDLTVEFVVAGGTVYGPGATDPAGLAGFSGLAYALYRPTNVTGSEGILGTGVKTLTDGSMFTAKGLGAGSAIAIYEGGAVDLDPGIDAFPDQASTLVAASDGALQGAFGFGTHAVPSDWGAAGNGYWFSQVIYASGVALPTGAFYYGLSAITGPGSDGPLTVYGNRPLFNEELSIGDAGAVDAVAGSSILENFSLDTDDSPGNPGAVVVGGGVTQFIFVGSGTITLNGPAMGPPNGPFGLASRDPAFVNPNTPEPGSMVLALLGAACAVPFVRRRRKNREQAA